MPVHIYRVTAEDEDNQHIATLCENEWHLAPSVDALSSWVRERGADLRPDAYVADVGFCWRRDAASGGPVIEAPILRKMGEIGMTFFLSEFSGFADEADDLPAEKSD